LVVSLIRVACAPPITTGGTPIGVPLDAYSAAAA
jgi:hypothetical protein